MITRHGIWLKESEAVARRGPLKRVFFKILLNLQERICVKIDFSIKFRHGGQHLHKYRLQYECFTVNFATTNSYS